MQVQRLDQEVNGPIPHRGRDRRKILISGHDDHGDVRTAFPQEPQQLEPVHTRQAHIHQRDVGVDFGEHRERRLRARGRGHGQGRSVERIEE